MNNVNAEALASIFTIQDGILKILLIKKSTEPYKGYWILPGGIITKDKTLEETLEYSIKEQVGLKNLKYEESSIFSDINRVPNKRLLGLSLISIVDEVKVRSQQEPTNYEYLWFPIENLPKIGYDHSSIVEKSVELLKSKLNQSKTLMQIYPSDFTLPEIQRLCEQVLTKEIDRRNFRKKFLTLNLIEETGDKIAGAAGRPAKLYRFKEDADNIILF